MSIISLGYRQLTKLYRVGYQWGLLKQHQFGIPVIGVGNLEVCGTGKTSTVIDLAHKLVLNGFRPAIVVKGYRKVGRSKVFGFSSMGGDPKQWLSELGDDGCLIAQCLCGHEAWVIAAQRKWQGVAWAEQFTNCDVVLVDDALQHFALLCDRMIVTTSSQALIQGNLRGKLLRQGPTDIMEDLEWMWVCTQNTDSIEGPSWAFVPHRLKALDLKLGSRPIDWIFGKEVQILCGTGQPNRFVATCRETGMDIVHVTTVRDHYQYTQGFCQKLVKQHPQVEDWVISSKDAVKLRPEWFYPSRVWVLESKITWNTYFSEQLWPWMVSLVRNKSCNL